MSLKTEIIETPDITLTAQHNDKLKIYVNDNLIKFTALIDNCGACFTLDKKTLLDAIK